LVWMKEKKLSPGAKAFLTYVEEKKESIIQNKFGWTSGY